MLSKWKLEVNGGYSKEQGGVQGNNGNEVIEQVDTMKCIGVTITKQFGKVK